MGALGRRLMSQDGGDPTWVVLRIGPLTTRAPVRVAESRDHHKHLGYVAILGIAAGMLALLCFYFCVWLIRQSRQLKALRPGGVGGEGSRATVEPEKIRRSGEGEGEKQTWNVGDVELVLMAGEHMPTYLAHPVVQCPPLSLATPAACRAHLHSSPSECKLDADRRCRL